MKITIDQSILSVIEDFNIVALSMDCVYEETNETVDEYIKSLEEDIKSRYTLEDVLNIPFIKEGRDGYKKLKKDPSRYRLACESLLRRLVKGNSLYRINNLVDIGNCLSILTNRSVACLDYDKIEGDITVRLGKSTDIYEGIGRGIINIENIPLYEDSIGPFGSTTSDTIRTSITNNTKKVLLFIVCFGKGNLETQKNLAIDLYTKYCHATNIITCEVNKQNK